MPKASKVKRYVLFHPSSNVTFMTISEIKQLVESKVDIVSLISRFVKLKKRGVEYLGLCPFHNEKSPSFSVNPIKDIYKCFGCGASGNSITFIMTHEKLGFIDAIKYIANLEQLPVNFEIEKKNSHQATQQSEKINFVPKEILAKTLNYYDANPFFVWLKGLVGEQRAIKAVADDYYVGTAKEGGTIYWQVDQFMRIRTGQRIFYNDDGHRKKEIPPKRLFTTEKGYKPCFFGEHQLLTADKDTIVGIVEAEKSAIICSIYLPMLHGKKVIWLGAGGMNGLTEEKIWALKGLNVCLVPDYQFLSRMTWGTIEMRKKIDSEDGRLKPHPQGEIDKDYVSIAMKLKKLGCNVSSYDLFSEREDKSDIADELIKYGCPTFIEQPYFNDLLLEEPGF